MRPAIFFLLCIGLPAALAQPAPFAPELPHPPLFAFEKVIHAQNDRRERCPYYLGLADHWGGIVQSAPDAYPGARPRQTSISENILAGWWLSPEPFCRVAPDASKPLQIGAVGRTLTIPDGWADRPIFLRLQASNCKLKLKIDQAPEAALPIQSTPLDLRLAEQLKPGQHAFQFTIEPLVSPDTSFAAQWNYVGLLHEPYLYCPPPVHIFDFSATPGRDSATGVDTLSFTAKTRNLSNAPPPKLKLEVYLFDAGGNRVFNRILAPQLEAPPGQTAPHTLLQRVPNPRRSTPDDPYGYTVLFALVGPEDRPTQIERMTVQFR